MRLPKFNFGTASPTRCTNYSVLPESRFCHTFCTLGFKCMFKLLVVDFKFLSSDAAAPLRRHGDRDRDRHGHGRRFRLAAARPLPAYH